MELVMERTKRRLVSIQTIDDLQPIPGADLIEVATVMGWNIVVKKGEFQVGDTCVYFEVDSFLPITDERFSFLKDSSFKRSELLGEGYRIRTVMLRKQLSQGLVFPLSVFPEVAGLVVGADVTELLQVQKWVIPEVIGTMGTVIADYPANIPKSNELRLQSYLALLSELTGKPYYIAMKMDGTSVTIFEKDGEVHVCTRNSEIAEDKDSPIWKYIHRNNLVEKLKAMGKGITLQGELCGPKIQKNRLKLQTHEVYFFNVRDEQSKLLAFDDFLETLKQLEVASVPILEQGDCFNYTLAELIEKAKGRYPSGNPMEGNVIRPKEPIISSITGKELSFKVLNNQFLLKED